MLFLPHAPLANNVFCFCTSVHGGVSEGPYKSFNLGMHVGDNSHRVATNRALLRSIITQQVSNRLDDDKKDIELSLAPIKWLQQAHSSILANYADLPNVTDTLDVKDSGNISSASADLTSALACDGIFTSDINTPLAVMTADCLPLVFACEKSGKIAAVHAGWRGLLNGIISKTLQEFSHKSSLRVWIGPSISQAYFEVSQDFVESFGEYKNQMKTTGKVDKFLVDLGAIAIQQLNAQGVVNIEKSPVCSYASNDCFSHRAASHQGSINTGRMATVVVRI